MSDAPPCPRVKCNKCGHVAPATEFPTGRDFFQRPFIRACPKCDNRQAPGSASLRMMPGVEHPFAFVRASAPADADAVEKVLRDAHEAS